MKKLCGAKFLKGGWYCTRERNHEGDHIASVGEYHPNSHVLAQWPQEIPEPVAEKGRQP